MDAPERLSPWWKHSVILAVVAGFTILIWLAAKSYRDAHVPGSADWIPGLEASAKLRLLRGQVPRIQEGFVRVSS